MKKEVFAYPVEDGTIMDYVEDRFILVIKDDQWSPEELRLLEQPLELHLCYTADIFIVVLEGGALDSGDFYFNIQESDGKDELLKQDTLTFEAVFLNHDNEICLKKSKTLNKEESSIVLKQLHQQATVTFIGEEYDVNVQGIQSAYEPYELIKFAMVSTKI